MTPSVLWQGTVVWRSDVLAVRVVEYPDSEPCAEKKEPSVRTFWHPVLGTAVSSDWMTVDAGLEVKILREAIKTSRALGRRESGESKETPP